MSHHVVFVGGWGRSGSTLLDRLLGGLPDVVSVGETRDIWAHGVLEDRLCGCGEPFSGCSFWQEVGREAFGGWDPDHARALHRLRRRVDRPWMLPGLLAPVLLGRRRRAELRDYTAALARLQAAVARVSGAGVVVESSKIPTYGLLLHRAGVPVRVLHLVRDSRGVVHSWRKQVQRVDVTDRTDYMHRYSAAAGAARYLLYNASTHLLHLARLPYQRVRYEDLVASPDTVLPRLASYAGAVVPSELATALRSGSVDLGPSHTVDGNPMRFAVGPLRIRRDEAWRRDLPRHQQALVRALTAPLLARYGYLRRARTAVPRLRVAK